MWGINPRNMKKIYLLASLISLINLLSAQEIKPPIAKKVLLEYSAKEMRTRQMEFYWAGWNFVEQKDVFRLKTPRDTLFFYMGNEVDGTERYEVIPRGGTPGSVPDKYILKELNKKLSETLMLTFSDSDTERNRTLCMVKLLWQYPIIWCDPDLFPIKKNVDEYFINKQWGNLVKTKGNEIRALAFILGVAEGATPNYEEKYIIYDYLKKMSEVKLERDGKKYSFVIHTHQKEGATPGFYRISGKIGTEGSISETDRKIITPVECISK